MPTDMNIIDAIEAFANVIAQRVVAQLDGQRTAEVLPRLLDVTQAAKYTGRSKQAIYHMVTQGRIPNKRDGSRVFFDRLELDAWISSMPSGSE